MYPRNSVPTLSVFFGRGSGSLKTVIVVQEDHTARPNGNIGSTMEISVVAKLGPTPCCSCSVLCVCSTHSSPAAAVDSKPSL